MNPQGHQREGATHERKDADVIGLSMIAALVLLTVGISLLVSLGLLHFLNRGHEAQVPRRVQLAKQAGQFPTPQLLVDAGGERAKTELAAQAKLQNYGWVDRKAGVAHIPIKRAMQLLVERGLPDVGAGQTRLQLLQSRPETDIQPKEPITSPAPEPSP